MQLLTFSSVNDRRAMISGQNLLDYVTYASAGSGYAFPNIQNGIVTLNRTLTLNNRSTIIITST
ncbi:MAG: hypothetical protein O7C58_08625 [Rickettsia endosymbiont of Ixodes persulcatus]|nr:hypothetical protein [Rickettsia endosymbiont of Ixodes persulcatus]